MTTGNRKPPSPQGPSPQGPQYLQNQGYQPAPTPPRVPPEKQAEQDGRQSNFPDVDRSGHLKDQVDPPPPLPHEGKGAKLPR
jgi:hypothetical protein